MEMYSSLGTHSGHSQSLWAIRVNSISLGWFLGSLPSSLLANGKYIYYLLMAASDMGETKGIIQEPLKPRYHHVIPRGYLWPSFLCYSWKMRRHSPLPSDLPWSCWQLFCSFLFLPLTPSTRGDLTTLSILCFLHLFFLYWLHSKLHVSQTWHTWSLRPSGSLWGGGGVGFERISSVYLGMCAAPWTSAHFSLTITSLIGTLKNVSRHC